MSEMSALSGNCSANAAASVMVFKKAMEMEKALMGELVQGVVDASNQNLGDSVSISDEALALYDAMMGEG